MRVSKSFFFIAAVGVLLCSCSDKKEKDAKEAIQKKISGLADGNLTLIEFKKTDGNEGEFFGQKLYQLFYEATLEYKADGYYRGCSNMLFRTDKTGFAYDEDYRPKGHRIKITGDFTFVKRESGWIVDRFDIDNCTDVTSVDKVEKPAENLPFVGKRYYNTHPLLSGSGTAQYYIDIKPNGDVFFGYDTPGSNVDGSHKETNAGKFKPIMECNSADCATGKLFSIKLNEVLVVDSKGETVFSSDCCDIGETAESEGDEVICPCDSEYRQ